MDHRHYHLHTRHQFQPGDHLWLENQGAPSLHSCNHQVWLSVHHEHQRECQNTNLNVSNQTNVLNFSRILRGQRCNTYAEMISRIFHHCLTRQIEKRGLGSVLLYSEQQCRQHTLYSQKARYEMPIRIPVRIYQIIWLAIQGLSCQKFQTIKVQILR